MSKHKNLAVTEAARRAGRQIAIAGVCGRRLGALMAEGERIAASLPNGHQRALQAVSSNDGCGFSALIKHGNTTLQIEGNSFAVTTHD
jgi:hypothetical protein